MFTKHNTDQHIFLFYVKLVIHMINFKIFPVSFMQVFHTIRHIWPSSYQQADRDSGVDVHS